MDEYGARAEESLRDAIATRRPPGTGSVTAATTLGELLTNYIDQARQDGELAPKSVDTYEATIAAVRKRRDDIRVGEASPGLIDEILRGIRRDHGATRERHTKVALNSIMTDAVLAGAITANPVRELGTRRKRKADKKVKGATALGRADPAAPGDHARGDRSAAWRAVGVAVGGHRPRRSARRRCAPRSCG